MHSPGFGVSFHAYAPNCGHNWPGQRRVSCHAAIHVRAAGLQRPHMLRMSSTSCRFLRLMLRPQPTPSAFTYIFYSLIHCLTECRRSSRQPPARRRDPHDLRNIDVGVHPRVGPSILRCTAWGTGRHGASHAPGLDVNELQLCQSPAIPASAQH